MHLSLLLLALLQQPAAPTLPPSPVVKVEITPAGGELQIGQTLQLSARALDAGGQPVPNARIYWFVGSDNGGVDSTGLVTAGYAGPLRVGAVAAVIGTQGQQIGFAVYRILPEPPARVEVTPAPSKLVAGTRLTLNGTAYSAHDDVRHDPVTFTSSNPRVASVSTEGVLRALAPGRVTVTAKAGPATRALAIQVVANTVTRVTLEPAATSVRTGDVVRFTAIAKDAAGRSIPGVTAGWSLEAGSGAAELDPDGAFVAELPGTYTVTASIGTRQADRHSARTSSAIARTGPLAGSPERHRSSSQPSKASGAGSSRTVSSSSRRLIAIPIASGLVPRLRRRRRPPDASSAISNVAAEVRIDEVLAEVLPSRKADLVQKLQLSGLTTCGPPPCDRPGSNPSSASDAPARCVARAGCGRPIPRSHRT